MYKIDSGGIEGALKCPEDLTKLRIKNNKDVNQDWNMFALVLSACNPRKSGDCVTDPEAIHEYTS